MENVNNEGEPATSVEKLQLDSSGDVYLVLYRQICDDDLDLASELRVQASAKCLSLASSVFRRMLQGHFKDGDSLRTQSEVEIQLPDDDAEAFLILLNMIHYHHRKVPRSVTLEQLTQIACLVDKYELHEAAELNTDMWVKALTKQLPRSLDSRVVPWLCISWVFRKEAQFRNVTEILLWWSEKPLEVDGLPIPSDLLEYIDFQRRQSILRVASSLRTHRENLMRGGRMCTLPCDARLLGVLTMDCYKMRLLNYTPQSPLYGHNVNTVSQQLATVVCHLREEDIKCQPSKFYDLGCPNSQILREYEEQLVQQLRMDTEGIDLKRYITARERMNPDDSFPSPLFDMNSTGPRFMF